MFLYIYHKEIPLWMYLHTKPMVIQSNYLLLKPMVIQSKHILLKPMLIQSKHILLSQWLFSLNIYWYN